MYKKEHRYDCPVCIGLPMVKLKLLPAEDTLLDHCRRCGGIWFDHGEVDFLRRLRPRALASKIVLDHRAHCMRCRSCAALIDRNVARCPECRRRNVIDCPICEQPMQNKEYLNLRLDFCRRCKGVWFDQIELAEIWNEKLEAMARKERVREGQGSSGFGGNVSVFAEVLGWDPGVGAYAVEAVIDAGHAMVEASGGALANAPELAGAAVEATGELAGAAVEGTVELAGAVVEGTGELAGAVFEGIAEIIRGIFL